MMTLNRIVPKGVNLLQKSVVRFKSTTSTESSFPRNDERLSAKEVWKHIVRIVTGKSPQEVASIVVIFTGLAGALLIAWEFFTIKEVKLQISDIKTEIVGMRQDMATQGARIDNLFKTFMDQTIDNQKQFAVQSKEIADASKKADERYYELLNAIKSERK
jgi:hypothetical protein